MFSDESRAKNTGLFVVAGFSINSYHTETWRELVTAERVTGKGLRDWHSTKEPKTRRRYLETALAIPHLHGRVFYRVHWEEPDDYWEATVSTLRAATERFAKDEHCILSHEGFTDG